MKDNNYQFQLSIIYLLYYEEFILYMRTIDGMLCEPCPVSIPKTDVIDTVYFSSTIVNH